MRERIGFIQVSLHKTVALTILQPVLRAGYLVNKIYTIIMQKPIEAMVILDLLAVKYVSWNN